MSEIFLDKNIAYKAEKEALDRIHAEKEKASIELKKRLSLVDSWSFEAEHGFALLRPVGPYIVVKIYTQRLSDSIVITDGTRQSQKWISNVGRVSAIGNACYKEERFKDWDVLPKIGDWVVFKVNAGPVIKFRGVDIAIMYDDAIKGIIEDPEHVSRD